ncbi:MULTISPECIES: DUF72 domain-containing protein [Exiguobacterium]|uniref:DUF72 domain-containing protein n=1 Tax=Exiguobacterium TaxID=33986 RepID=UPI000478AC16|nr:MULTISPECIES: DUF72 domain-containing protein [Exiguobacterium]MCK2156461.1 DUF72 domain-containing protein [Exiguobacterium sp. 17-1]
MIYVGVTGWGDHDSLYPTPQDRKEKLAAYAGHFPAVEVDSTYYAIQPERNYQKWVAETPDDFRFIVKVHRAMSGHDRENKDPLGPIFEQYLASIEPMRQSGKIAAILVQLPPWFDVSKVHLEYLQTIRKSLAGLPVAIEFRNPSWYSEAYQERTLRFLAEHQFIHTICDEPQTEDGSVPFVPVVTQETAFVRLHGRNINGWLKKPGQSSEDWRKVRCLYRYSEEELQGLATHIRSLAEQAKDVYVFFNNNSAGDAVPNAKRLIEILGLDYESLAPRQISLF